MRAAIWVLVPQATSRLSSIAVFALVAQRTQADQLGALALATVISGLSVSLAPAVVGKPLSAAPGDAVRREVAPMAQSAALVLAVAVGLVLTAAGLLSAGLTRLALLSAGLGVPATMAVESSYWRLVFLSGRRRAGLTLSVGYAAQSLFVAASVLTLPAESLILAPAVGLAIPGLVTLLVLRRLSWRGARSWLVERTALWFPFVVGVSAGIAVVQAIPLVLASSVGLEASAVYRGAELAFGATNLLIGVGTQTLLTQTTARPLSAYVRFAVPLAAIAVANGIALALVPSPLLRVLLGPTTPLLQDVLAIVTVQRVALAVSSMGAVLLVGLLPARRLGTFEVLSAALSLGALLVGTRLGLAGGLAGLAGAELILAVTYALLLRRST